MSSAGLSGSNHDFAETKTPRRQQVEVYTGNKNDRLKEDTNMPEADRNYLRVVHTDGTVDFVDNHAVGGDVDAMPKGYFRSPAFIGTVVAQCLANICAYLGWVLPANTLALINADLGNSPDINWVATVWTLGSCIGFLLVGRISDIFGRRYMVLGIGILGLIGCIIGSCAQSVGMLIAANICNGVAAAGQLSFGIVLGELVPNSMRGPIVTLVFMSSLPFAIFGPIIARLFIENTSSRWRWSYYLGDIFSVASLALYFFFYHPPTYNQLHVNGKTKRQQVKELDYVGMFLFIAGCVLFLIGLSWGGTAYSWASPQVLCTLITGFLTLAFFAIYEGYFCKVQPLMPPRLFKNVGFVAIVVIAAIGAMVYYSLTVIWPTLIQSIYTTDSTQIGLQSSVVGGGVLAGQVLGGLFISFVPKVKFQTIIAALLSFAFITSLLSLDKDRWAATIGLATCGLVAIGFIDNIAFPGVTLVLEPQDIGLATGVMGSLRALGGAVAQALYVSVLTNKLNEYVPAYVAPAATNAGLPPSSLTQLFAGITAGSFADVPGITDSIIAAVSNALKAAYTDAFKIVFYCTIPFSVILIIAAGFVPNMEQYLGHNVARRLQNQGPQTDVGEKPKTIDV
ncbi:fungal trichothecene efflux pump [Xylariales sp. AK1849]|nr:fungal trichothecene efflux pump [Xylariales sp. AK1849]